MKRQLATIARRLLDEVKLPEEALKERRRDQARALGEDRGIDATVRMAIDWLRRAQDRSATKDGGVAHSYSLIHGWSASYPETTGFIIPTLLGCAKRFNDQDLADRARRMLDWLVSIQFPEGGFQGGLVNAQPRVPVTFNTGQILIGLAAGARNFDAPYTDSMRRAADWLADSLDPDGCWRRHPSPFAKPGEKAYETHVSWGLYEAARVEPNTRWVEAADRQVRWALSKQRPNGWFASNCLSNSSAPFTHTIGYVLRGVVEAYRFTGDRAFLDAATRCATGALTALDADGRLPGRLDESWRATVDWVCLTGTVQIAHSWLLLADMTGNAAFATAAERANAFVRRSMRERGSPGVRGGIKGSLPCDGEYLQWCLPNWAAKFFIDANLLEADVRAGARPGAVTRELPVVCGASNAA
jgi:hypothetical protein